MNDAMFTTCARCGRMNIEIVDGCAPELCDECCICGTCTEDGFDHDECLERGSIEWRDIEA